MIKDAADGPDGGLAASEDLSHSDDDAHIELVLNQ